MFATGLVDFRNRWYDPELGRFLQQDPLGYRDGASLYAFVGWAPFDYFDLMGLLRKEILASGSRGDRRLQQRYAAAYELAKQTAFGRTAAHIIETSPEFVLEIYFDSASRGLTFDTTYDEFDEDGNQIRARLRVGRDWDSSIPASAVPYYPVCSKVNQDLSRICRVAHEEFGHGLGKFTDAAYRALPSALVSVREEIKSLHGQLRDELREKLGRPLKPRDFGAAQQRLEQDERFKRLQAEAELLKRALEHYPEDAARAVVEDPHLSGTDR